jgi:hypothetical protein
MCKSKSEGSSARLQLQNERLPHTSNASRSSDMPIHCCGQVILRRCKIWCKTTKSILHAILRSAKSFFSSVAMTTVNPFVKFSFAWYHVTRKITWPQEWLCTFSPDNELSWYLLCDKAMELVFEGPVSRLEKDRDRTGPRPIKTVTAVRSSVHGHFKIFKTDKNRS